MSRKAKERVSKEEKPVVSAVIKSPDALCRGSGARGSFLQGDGKRGWTVGALEAIGLGEAIRTESNTERRREATT